MLKAGEKLESLMCSAEHQVLLVSPFIKADILDRLLKRVPDYILLKCITRWRLDEILSGVSDIEIWPILSKRANSSLWLRQNLHAKYYRSASKCLIGSANLTGAALGWSAKSNLELLVELNFNNHDLVQFEEDLLSNCIEVNEDMYKHMVDMVSQLHKENTSFNKIIFKESLELPDMRTEHYVDFFYWLPNTRFPENIYIAYNGNSEELTSAAKESASTDLKALGEIVPGLTKSAFNIYISSILIQHPVINQLDSFVRIPQRFGAICEFLKAISTVRNHDHDVRRTWQTLMRWLLYFMPDRYGIKVPNYSEIFYRKDYTV